MCCHTRPLVVCTSKDHRIASTSPFSSFIRVTSNFLLAFALSQTTPLYLFLNAVQFKLPIFSLPLIISIVKSPIPQPLFPWRSTSHPPSPLSLSVSLSLSLPLSLPLSLSSLIHSRRVFVTVRCTALVRRRTCLVAHLLDTISRQFPALENCFCT